MEDGKFHPHTQAKGTRKSRDQKAKTQGVIIERKARENFSELLRNNLRTFNENYSPPLEYGDVGGKSKGLKIKGQMRFLVGKMTREEALDCVLLLQRYLDNPQSGKIINPRLKRGEPLQPFVKKNVAKSLAEINLFLKDLREEKSKRMREGKPTGIINTDLRLIGGARNSILTLLEQVPEQLHKEIVVDTIKIEKEMSS